MPTPSDSVPETISPRPQSRVIIVPVVPVVTREVLEVIRLGLAGSRSLSLRTDVARSAKYPPSLSMILGENFPLLSTTPPKAISFVTSAGEAGPDKPPRIGR